MTFHFQSILPLVWNSDQFQGREKDDLSSKQSERKASFPMWLLVSLIAAVYYVLASLLLGLTPSEELLMFSNDARGYLQIIHWLGAGQPTAYLGIRPYLYSMIMYYPYQLGGAVGVCIAQAMFWVATCSLIYSTCFRIMKRHWVGIAAAVLFASNLSLLALTYHLLTETVATFFMALLVWQVVVKIESLSSLGFILPFLFTLGMACLIKPVLFYPFLFVTVVLLPLCYWTRFLRKPIAVVWLILAVLPVLLQCVIVFERHESFAVSTIGGETIKNYLFAQGVARDIGVDHRTAVRVVNQMSGAQRCEYLGTHGLEYASMLLANAEQNIKGHSNFLRANPSAHKFQKQWNVCAYWLHVGLLILVFAAVAVARKLGDTQMAVVLVGFEMLNIYWLLTTGVSLWQGDRLSLPAMGLWIPLYGITIHYLMGNTKKVMPGNY